MVEALVGLLAALGQVSGVTLSTPVYATVSALHVVGIALLFGPIALVDLRLAGALRSLDVAALTLLRTTAKIGTGLAVLTGVLLASARPDEYFSNPTFVAKLAVVALALAQALVFEAPGPAGPFRGPGHRHRLARPLARRHRARALDRLHLSSTRRPATSTHSAR